MARSVDGSPGRRAASRTSRDPPPRPAGDDGQRLPAKSPAPGHRDHSGVQHVVAVGEVVDGSATSAGRVARATAAAAGNAAPLAGLTDSRATAPAGGSAWAS